MKNTYDLIEEINNSFDGIWFEKIKGISMVGEIRLPFNSYKYPIMYYAMTNCRDGDDNPFQGEGHTPVQAIRNLLKVLKKHFN